MALRLNSKVAKFMEGACEIGWYQSKLTQKAQGGSLSVDKKAKMWQKGSVRITKSQVHWGKK